MMRPSMRRLYMCQLRVVSELVRRLDVSTPSHLGVIFHRRFDRKHRRAAAAAPRHSVDVDIISRIDGYQWSSLAAHLDAHGWARFEQLLSDAECDAIAGLYPDDRHFRSHIVMARHGFGRGEYKYFSY